MEQDETYWKIGSGNKEQVEERRSTEKNYKQPTFIQQALSSFYWGDEKNICINGGRKRKKETI